MKKSASKLFIAAVLVFGCFIGVFAAHATEPSQDIAAEHGYTIFETSQGEKFYADEDGFAPNVMYVTVKQQIDITPYQNGTSNDFYGVEIVDITEMQPIYSDHPAGDGVDQPNGNASDDDPVAYEYRIVTANFYTYGQARVLFNNQSDIIYCSLLRLFTPENYGTKLGDVNQNGVIDARDYLLLKRTYFGTFVPTEQGLANGDINQNGKIDARDYLLLKRIYFGTYTIGSTPDQATNDQA